VTAAQETYEALGLAALDALVDTNVFRHKNVRVVQIGDRVWHTGTRRFERVIGRSTSAEDVVRLAFSLDDPGRPDVTKGYPTDADVLVADDPDDADWWNATNPGTPPEPTEPANAAIAWLDNELESNLRRGARVTAVRDSARAAGRTELADRAAALLKLIVALGEGLTHMRRYLLGQRR
jgi:hypothetical protein